VCVCMDLGWVVRQGEEWVRVVPISDPRGGGSVPAYTALLRLLF